MKCYIFDIQSGNQANKLSRAPLATLATNIRCDEKSERNSRQGARNRNQNGLYWSVLVLVHLVQLAQLVHLVLVDIVLVYLVQLVHLVCSVNLVVLVLIIFVSMSPPDLCQTEQKPDLVWIGFVGVSLVGQGGGDMCGRWVR